MRYLAALALLLIACDDDPLDDPDLHNVGDCGTEWSATGSQPDDCELACVTPPMMEQVISGTCTARNNTAAQPIDCGATNTKMFEFDGVRGCCWVEHGNSSEPLNRAVFAVCQD